MGEFWSQPLRVECGEVQLVTIRTINSALWFINNPELDQRILAFLAKYQKKYAVEIYAAVIMGNHIHLIVRFPRHNRAAFFRDFNARIAESVRILVPNFLGGPLFEDRYSPQALPTPSDVLKYFIYCAVQPISAGLCDRISDYPGYNSFSDAASARTKTYRWFCFGAYNAAKRRNPHVRMKDYYEEHQLVFTKLPGFNTLSSSEYKNKLLKLVAHERDKSVEQRGKEGKPFLGVERIKQIIPGTIPHKTKKGGIRPLVLSVCREARTKYLSWYFSIVERYQTAVKEYRRGKFDVEFPPGTYRPSGMNIDSG